MSTVFYFDGFASALLKRLQAKIGIENDFALNGYWITVHAKRVYFCFRHFSHHGSALLFGLQLSTKIADDNVKC